VGSVAGTPVDQLTHDVGVAGMALFLVTGAV